MSNQYGHTVTCFGKKPTDFESMSLAIARRILKDLECVTEWTYSTAGYHTGMGEFDARGFCWRLQRNYDRDQKTHVWLIIDEDRELEIPFCDNILTNIQTATEELSYAKHIEEKTKLMREVFYEWREK